MKFSPLADITIETRFPKTHMHNTQTHTMVVTVLVYLVLWEHGERCQYLWSTAFTHRDMLIKKGPMPLLVSFEGQDNKPRTHTQTQSGPDISDWT